MHGRLAWFGTRPERLRLVLGRLREVEIGVVRAESARAKACHARRIVLAINSLANGWLYGLVALAIIWTEGLRARHTLTAMALSLVGSHLLYPVVKSYVARPRPFECDSALDCLTTPLDRFSFPSGHCMTAAAALFPVAFVHPTTVAPILTYTVVLAWVRLALAHHYPSDVVGGTALGLTVAVPITYVCCG
jgi:undecaprenyl-diphosphatase